MIQSRIIEKIVRQNMKLKNRKRFFIHAPAFYGNKDTETGEFVSRRLRTIQNPFDDETKPWRRNIYYFWWEFLKRHEGYLKCCERGGTGEYGELYADWGDIHEYKNFWQWWREEVETTETRGEYLFAEPYEFRQVEEVWSFDDQSEDDLIVRIPLEVRTGELTRSLRRLLQQYTDRSRQARRKSRARYPVNASVPLYTLNKCLEVYDLHEQYREDITTKKLNKYELCDMAQLNYDNKFDGMTLKRWEQECGANSKEAKEARKAIITRKNTAVNRYLNAANAYLDKVGKGKFPLRASKDKNKTAD